MLNWAAYSAAMPNGEDRIKKTAAVVAARTNDEDGVADLIERYVLGGEDFPEKNETQRQ
jgi:hydroxymethylpyrimidine pyrophosphatase-like HAD family hydrolase